MYVSKGPKSSTKINTVPVNKTRMSIPDVTHRRGRRNLRKLGDLVLMNSTKNRLEAPRSCSSRLVTGMRMQFYFEKSLKSIVAKIFKL